MGEEKDSSKGDAASWQCAAEKNSMMIKNLFERTNTTSRFSIVVFLMGVLFALAFVSSAFIHSVASAASCGQLASGASMKPLQSIYSCNGRYVLMFQGDANVVLYPSNHIDAEHALWATGTSGQPAGTFDMQGDGNLILRDTSGGLLWASLQHGGTIGKSGYLVVQDDGNLVVFATVGGAVMWQSKTNFSHKLAMDDRGFGLPAGGYPRATAGARFDDYLHMGIGDLIFDYEWRMFEGSEGSWNDYTNFRSYMQTAVDRGMGFKILLATINSPPQWFLNKYPDARIVDQQGKYSTNMVSYWYAGIRPLMEQKTDYLFNQLKQWGFLDNVNYIGIPLGPASEPIYPAAWTTLSSYESFWWYAPNAQADFVVKMQAKYGTISAANAVWSTSYASWSSVSIPAVGTKTGPMWNDVLLWYRDTKRNFIDWQIQNYKRALAKYADPAHRPQLIIFVPCDPSYISAADWDAAVASGGGNTTVKLMCDSEYLIEEALKYGLHLEYTGLPADHVIAGLKSRMQARGMVSPLHGENVGGYFHSNADLDANYNSIVRGNLYAFDFVSAGSLLYASDGITKTSQYSGVANLFQRLRTFYNRSNIPRPPTPTPVTPTATLTASPSSITAGQSSTLTYSSTNATSCTGTRFTATGTSGSVVVTPSLTTTYSINCGGKVVSATVTVSTITALIKGKRVLMPGNIPDSATQTVWVTGGSPKSDANPYSLTVNAGTTYTVNVATRAGYTIGYTLCIDNIACHGQTPTPGTSATVIIPAGTGHYADLWWHYTPLVIPPLPTNLKATCNIDGTKATLSWTPAVGATSYALRLDYRANNATSCTGGWFCAQSPDYQTSTLPSATYTATTVPGATYGWWVHSVGPGGWSTPTGGAAFICNPPPATVTGFVDGVSTTNTVNGWACQKKNPASINVHLYVGGPAGTGTFIGSYLANQSSAAPVATACESTGIIYRYSIPLSSATMQQHAGKLIYVHGISPVTGGTNVLLTKSGTYKVPTLPPPPPTNLKATCSIVDGATKAWLRWDPAPGATTYALRLDYKANNASACTDGWLCAQPPDFSNNSVGGYLGPITPGAYGWWVHSVGPGGWSTPTGGAAFICNPPPAPTATITQNKNTTTSDGTTGQTFTISWGSTNVTSCVVQKSGPGGAITNPWATGTSGSRDSVPAPIGTHRWWVDCTGPSGTAHAELNHSVIAATSCGILASGASLTPTQTIKSCNGIYTLAFQGDGNVVLYKGALSIPNALWSTRTNGMPAAMLVMQGDGNLVLYKAGVQSNATALWASGSIPPTWKTGGGTFGKPGYLAVQGDGNLVIYATTDGSVMWASNTVQASAPFTHTLARGWTGEEVSTLQASLAKLGYYAGEITGYFGPQTEEAVKTLQLQNNLAAVGILGPQTRSLLQRLLGL